jgi:hypothetical protein
LQQNHYLDAVLNNNKNQLSYLSGRCSALAILLRTTDANIALRLSRSGVCPQHLTSAKSSLSSSHQ